MNLPPDKATLTSLLRGLLIAEISLIGICLILAGFESWSSASILAEHGLNIETTGAQDLVGAFTVVMLVVCLPLIITSWVGLFRQRNWARWLYLCVSLMGILITLFVGVLDWQYRWSFVVALEYLIGPVNGLILGISFLSPLATDFTKVESAQTSA